MKRFRYPSSDEILEPQWASNFLRSRRGFSSLFDPNYIRNQRDATNYFLSWLETPSQVSYREMLRIQHRLAALGKSGRRTYSIPLPKGIRLMAKKPQMGQIRYKSFDKNNWRETHVGVFRDELEDRGIEHTANDIICLPKNIRDIMFGVPEKNAYNTPSFQLKFRGLKNVKIDVRRVKGMIFERQAPKGKSREKLFAFCEAIMTKIQKQVAKAGGEKQVLALLPKYYHAAINLMPFANINNSIFMAHVNAIRRLIGAKPLLHKYWDYIALISSVECFNLLSFEWKK